MRLTCTIPSANMRFDQVLIGGISTRAEGPSADTSDQHEVKPHLARGTVRVGCFLRVLGDDNMLMHFLCAAKKYENVH